MSIKEVEEKVIQLAHIFSKRFGEEILELSENELIAYLTAEFDYESWKIFAFYKYQMLALFLKTAKEDLSKS